MGRGAILSSHPSTFRQVAISPPRSKNLRFFFSFFWIDTQRIPSSQRSFCCFSQNERSDGSLSPFDSCDTLSSWSPSSLAPAGLPMYQSRPFLLSKMLPSSSYRLTARTFRPEKLARVLSPFSLSLSGETIRSALETPLSRPLCVFSQMSATDI